MLLLLSHFSRVRLCATPWTATHQAPLSWDSPGKNTGVGCHFLLNAWKWKVKVKSLSHVWLLATPWTCSPPGSSVHGICQAKCKTIYLDALLHLLWKYIFRFSNTVILALTLLKLKNIAPSDHTILHFH